MKVFLLAAGKGERLRPLTSTCPKPLLQIDEHTLIEHLIQKLAKDGFKDFIINIAYLKEQFKDKLGDGSALGVNITFSEEEPGELETGGAIIRALPLLGDDPFLTISADIWTDFPFHTLKETKPDFGHLVLVNNPDFHPNGDFYFDGSHASNYGKPSERFTYANIGIFNPNIFKTYPHGHRKLGTIWQDVLEKHPKAMSAQLFAGQWRNVTTVEHLHALQKYIASLTPQQSK